MGDSVERAATRAVEAARVAVDAPADAQAVWRVVTRLDAGRPRYLLVGITSGQAGWVAAVSLDGQVQGYAADPAGAQAWWAGVSEELVWAPGSSSRSPLCPLRRSVAGGQVIFLDHLGQRVPGMSGGRG